MRANPITPPTTPPAIAPVLLELGAGLGLADLVDEAVPLVAVRVLVGALRVK